MNSERCRWDEKIDKTDKATILATNELSSSVASVIRNGDTGFSNISSARRSLNVAVEPGDGSYCGNLIAHGPGDRQRPLIDHTRGLCLSSAPGNMAGLIGNTAVLGPSIAGSAASCSDYAPRGYGSRNGHCRVGGFGRGNSLSTVGRDNSSNLCPRLRRDFMRGLAVFALELMPPPIDNDLHEIMRDMGAEIDDSGVVMTFGNDDEAIAAAEQGVAVVEMSHYGRLRVTGDDRLHFLHNQSTADFKLMKASQGCYTVFTTPTARTIDLAKAWIMTNSVILVLSPSTRKSIYDRLNKYIFFADKVEIEDITDKTYLFSITGPSSDELLRELNLEEIIGKPFGTHLHYAVEGTPVTIAVGSGFAGEGYSMLLSTSTAGFVWQTLLKSGAVPMGATAAERLRVLQGKPAPGSELTDDYNVLEAGLWRTISLTKGCYIGQETIAKLITYSGVKQELWGIELEAAVTPGTAIMLDGQKVGKLTSCTIGRDNLKHFGLGYIKNKAGGAGIHVDVAGVSGTVVDIPFITRSLPE
ncbi:hypothetical protein Mapa_008890 [Marchantia paleacea]|nr:hypothetical protein Mapa_008890 [Marchantia paleacea]